jgi:hypothetical protein
VSIRALVWVPILVVGAFVVAWFAAPPAARDTLLVVEIESAKALGLFGCAAAALIFEPGDYLRRAWLLLGASTLFLFTRDVFALASHAGPHDSASLVVEGVLATLGNGCLVAGTSMLARAWRVAGFDGTPGRGGAAVLVGAVAVAALVTGWPIVADMRALAGGDAFAIVPLASDLADGVVLVLLATLARTALALRGGVLRWPWAFLTASGLLWLVFDLAYDALSAAHADVDQAHGVLEALRALATLYGFSAGLAQRNVLVLAGE